MPEVVKPKRFCGCRKRSWRRPMSRGTSRQQNTPLFSGVSWYACHVRSVWRAMALAPLATDHSHILPMFSILFRLPILVNLNPAKLAKKRAGLPAREGLLCGSFATRVLASCFRAATSPHTVGQAVSQMGRIGDAVGKETGGRALRPARAAMISRRSPPQQRERLRGQGCNSGGALRRGSQERRLSCRRR